MDDESSDEELQIESIVEFIATKYKININDLKIIIDDVLFDSQNFTDLRFEMHECVTYVLDFNIKLLSNLSNIVLRQ